MDPWFRYSEVKSRGTSPHRCSLDPVVVASRPWSDQGSRTYQCVLEYGCIEIWSSSLFCEESVSFLACPTQYLSLTVNRGVPLVLGCSPGVPDIQYRWEEGAVLEVRRDGNFCVQGWWPRIGVGEGTWVIDRGVSFVVSLDLGNQWVTTSPVDFTRSIHTGIPISPSLSPTLPKSPSLPPRSKAFLLAPQQCPWPHTQATSQRQKIV